MRTQLLMNSCLLFPRTFRHLLTCLSFLRPLLTSAMEAVISDTKARVIETVSAVVVEARNMVDVVITVVTVTKIITDVEAVTMVNKATTVERKEAT